MTCAYEASADAQFKYCMSIAGTDYNAEDKTKQPRCK